MSFSGVATQDLERPEGVNISMPRKIYQKTGRGRAPPRLADPKAGLTQRLRVALEDAIVTGELRPGDALDDQALSKRFGTSRTPVREALLQLAALGVVTIVPRSGMYVARANPKELLALFECLGLLEGIAARLACQRMSAAERHALADIHESGKARVRKGSVGEYASYNVQFHEAIYRGSGNEVLADHVRRLRARLAMHERDVFGDQSRTANSAAEHGAVVEAILRGDVVGAEQAMIDHVAAGGRAYAKVVLENP